MDISKLQKWAPPGDWTKITTLDAHTEGEPLRVIIDGLGKIKGKSILEKRKFVKENFDFIRTALMWEPRGHADMYGCIITPPENEDSDFGVLFLHNEGYSTMCGHGILAVTKIVLETGFINITPPLTKIKIDTPAGPVLAFGRTENNSVTNVYFQNVPSFVYATDKTVFTPSYGEVTFDIAFGGAFYAYINSESLGLGCNPENMRELIFAGMEIKKAVMKSIKLVHPFENELNFLYGTIFTAPPVDDNSHSRNVCVFAEGEVDRSPTGTGVSGRLALLLHRDEVNLNEDIVIESIINSKFKVRGIKMVNYGPYSAVIPQVEGTSFITGRNEFYLDINDPLKHGFILR